ncbi:MAG: twin-arginine translocase TatA/TatE family subunit [Thermodesulfobacteriota bacterium]
MFGIGTTEILIILVVALLVIGPTKLPEVAKSLGRGMAEFKRMSSDVKNTIDWEAQAKEEESAKSGESSDGEEPREIGSDTSTPDDELVERPVDEANVEMQSAEKSSTSTVQDDTARDKSGENGTDAHKEQSRDER